VLDRLIQQSILQVLQPRFDPTFSEHSYGFRPGRNAHQAVRAAQGHVQEGKRIVVDADLEQFFDRVNHDVLMGRVAQRLADRRLLSLIRRYLNAGMMQQGVVRERDEGTPQGSPLSPLLANVLLDEVDRALEARGLAFVRYADDLNIYVRSWRAGRDAMETLRRLYGRLRLRLNEQKSAVARVWSRTFLGYSFWAAPGRTVKPRIGSEALNAMKHRVRTITARTRGRSMTAVISELRRYLTGWKAYFQLAESPQILGECDEWIRHRLRALQLKQWKRGPVIYRELRRLGAPEWLARATAAGRRRRWFTAAVGLNSAMPARYYDQLGVPRMGPGPLTF